MINITFLSALVVFVHLGVEIVQIVEEDVDGDLDAIVTADSLPPPIKRIKLLPSEDDAAAQPIDTLGMLIFL